MHSSQMLNTNYGPKTVRLTKLDSRLFRLQRCQGAGKEEHAWNKAGGILDAEHLPGQWGRGRQLLASAYWSWALS